MLKPFLKISILALSFISNISFSQDINTRGLKVLLDHDTGCQYIFTKSSIILRKTFNGETLCGKKIDKKTLLSAQKAIISIDTGTGCEFIQAVNSYGITERLNKEGKQICSTKNIANYPPFPI